MPRLCAGSGFILWLPVLFLALGPTASAVDDEAPALETPALESPAAPPSNAASLIPANTPPTLKALGGAVRPGGHLVLAAYATDADSGLVQVLATLHLRPGQPAPAWLEQTSWASPLASFPLLEIAVSPPADAAPETYVIEVSATDDGGLSALGEMLLEVLPPEAPAAPPPGSSPASAQGASSSSAAAVGGASSGVAGAAAAKAASSSSSESPSLSLSVSPASVAEGSIRDIVVTGTLMGVSMVPGVDVTGALQVSGTATDGTDYSLSGTKSLVIPAGSATLTGTRTLRLSALGDVREREGDETVKFKVTQVTRGTEVLALSSTAKASVTITNVYAKPPKVSGVTAQTASDSSLKVAWEAPEASPPVTKYIVQYRRDDKPEKQWARAAEVSGEVLEALATGLHSGRRYDVQVRAKNGAGKGAWSDEATANTAPKVTLEAADGGVASIREGNASVGVALTGWAKAQGGGGTLTGQWLKVTGSGSSETETAWGSSFTMASKRDYEKTARSDVPETRKYRLRVTHDLSGERATVDRDATVTWLPKVLLSASPSSVPEDGGARTVTVEAKLTGRTVSAASKSVRVNVKGDTATEGTDFAEVSSFTISIPGGDRSATGTFELSPVADSASEGGETVKLKGSATEGDQELKARNGEVTIEDEQVTLTVSPTPTNGSVTGTGIACGTGTAGDCSESVTKSTPLTLAASPASGWVFRKWSGACSEDEDASCALTVSGATTVGASFRRPKVKVEVSPAAGGSVTGTGISCGAGTTNDCSERVSTGSIALTAAPASGYVVSSWSGGNCTGKGTTCTATVTEDVTVTVTFAEGSVPSAPSGLSVAPGDGSVALSWTDPGDASITGYEIRRKAGSGAYGTWADISGSDADTTSHSVTGLTNGTAYTFELRAENASGTGAGAEVSATPKAIPGLVTDVTATATGAATASLSWTAPASGGAVDSYTVSGSGTIAVSGTSATITGLVQDTDYKWTVQAVNGSGSGEAAESNTISIPQVPGRVTNLLAAAASDSSATLNWTAPAITATEGEAASYAVSGEGTIAVSGTTATITGLAKDTDYSWIVAAVNVSGTGADRTSNTISIPQVPGRVTNLLAAAASDSSATLNWTAPAITATEGEAASYAVSGEGTIAVSGTTATITGLAKDTDYSWIVAAVNVSGTGADRTSNTISIPQVPGRVTNLLAAAASDSSATLNWTAPAVTATEGRAASYAVSGEGTIAVSGTTATITGLSKDTDYSWIVAAVNVSGTGADRTSNTISIPQVPGRVTNLLAAAASDSSATLNWTAPAITATEGEAASYAVSGEGTIAVSGTTATITGLAKDTDYSWIVAAVNVSGTGADRTSNTISIPQVPGRVTNLLAAAASDSSATLNWTAPAVTATEGRAASYAVSGEGTIAVSGTTATITGLSKDTDYSWIVAAVNVSGTGADRTSNTISIPQVPGSVSGVTASATGAYTASLRWTAPTSGGTPASYSINGSGTATVSGTTATITGLVASTSYSWKVAAVNVSGASAEVTSNTISTHPLPPGPVRDLKKTSVTNKGATLNWKAPNTGGAASWYTVTGGGTVSISGTTATITRLAAKTRYTFRVKAHNSGGSSPERTITVTTLDNKPGPVRNLSGTATGQTTVDLDWDAPQAAQGKGTPTSYVISRDGASDVTVTETEATIPGLSANTRYTFRVKSKNDGGPSAAVSVSVKTWDNRPPPVRNLSGTATGQTTVDLDWDAPQAAQGKGTPTSYVISRDGASDVTVTETEATIPGLSANTRYTFRVKSKNDGGPSAAVSVSVKTWDNRPPPVRNLSGTATGQTTVDLDWDAPQAAQGKGTPTSYVISRDGASDVTVTETEATIPGLSANTRYTFRVKSKNDGGPSAAVSVSVKTWDNRPPPVRNLSGTATGQTTVDLDWDAPQAAQGKGTPTSYVISRDGASDVTVTETEATIPGLSANTRYTFRVKSKNDGGPSAAVSITIRTLARTTITAAVDPAAGGSVKADGINCGTGVTTSDCSQTEDEGTAIDPPFTHSASQHYRFKEWSCSPSTSPCPPTSYPSQDTTVTASFSKEYTLTVTSSSKGYVTWGTGQSQRINCGSGTGRTDCTETVLHDTSISLAATPNTGYRLKDWTCSPSSSPCPPAKMTGNLTVTPNFETTLTVDAGGPYQGTKVPGRHFYSVTVRATASGGAPPYSYSWEDKSANSRSATYLFPHPNGARLYGRGVTVTDANSETAARTATITIIPSMSGFSDEFAYAVPLSGALSLVWGGGGSVAATSGDAGIAGVSVNGAEIVVSGVSAGRTEISVRAGQEAFRVPVRVGGG